MPRRSLLWPDPRVKPPFGSVEIDRGHPLAQGLGAFWLLNEEAGTLLRSSVTGETFTLTAPLWAPTAQGVGITGDGTNYSTPLAGLSIPTLDNQASVSIVTRLRASVASNAFARILEKGANQEYSLCMNPDGTKLVMGASGGTQNCFSNAAITDGIWRHVVGTGTASTTNLYLNAIKQTDVGSGIGTGTNGFTLLNYGGGTGYSFKGDIEFLALYTRALSQNEITWSASAPYSLLRPILRRRYSVPAVGGITGTLANGTLEDIRVAIGFLATGTVAITGTAAQTLGALTSTAAGAVAITGSAAPTLDALTSVAAGTAPILGAAAPTLDVLTTVATGAVALTGASAPTLEPLTVLGSGVVGTTPILGTAALELAPLTSAAIGTLTLQGLASITFDGVTVAGVGIITGASPIAGTLAKNLDALTLVAVGASPVGPIIAPPSRPSRSFNRRRGTINLGPGSPRGNIPLGPGKRRRRP